MLSRPTVVQLAALGSVICSLALSQTALAQTAGLYPDLQTVVPRHLGIQNAAQREYLRFSNGIANTGPGDLRVRPEPPFGTPTPFTSAVQEVLDADGNVVSEHQAGQFAYHEAHNHWHIGDVALFEVRKARDKGTGPVDQDLLLPDRLVQARGQLKHQRSHLLGLRHELPGHLARMGRPVPPVS
jgi:hypothetical protein